MSKPFAFKQFEISQDQCAMKVGTDGVLLGAWTAISSEFSILDIGTGTGLIALMLAQRSNAEVIDALELDAPAFEQAVQNFEQSDWSDRLFCYHASLQTFTEEIDDTYDLIVSNPPFFTDSFSPNETARNKARFESAMPFDHLAKSAAKLLSQQGKFSVIVPYKESEKFITLCNSEGLNLERCCHVRGTENSPVKRSLLEFSFKESHPKYSSLVLEIERHQYTEDYQKLVKDFYLKL